MHKLVRFIGIAAVLLVIVLPFALLWYFQGYALSRHRAESSVVRQLIDRINVSRPQKIPADKWAELVGFTHNAVENVCAPQHVSNESFHSFRVALEAKLTNPVTLDTLSWVWEELQRIESTGTYETGYVSRYRPQFEQMKESLVSDDGPY